MGPWTATYTNMRIHRIQTYRTIYKNIFIDHSSEVYSTFTAVIYVLRHMYLIFLGSITLSTGHHTKIGHPNTRLSKGTSKIIDYFSLCRAETNIDYLDIAVCKPFTFHRLFLPLTSTGCSYKITPNIGLRYPYT